MSVAATRRPGRPARLRHVHSALAPALFAALACAMTWPLCIHVGTHLLRGSERFATVPLFNLWTLSWNADRLAHGYAGYWDAPIFYPSHGAFALSEPQPLTGLAFAALRLVGPDVVAFNLLQLLVLTANGLAARHMLRVMGATPPAALAGGALAVALPTVLKELGVLQLTLIFPLCMVLAELYRLWQRARPGAVVRLSLWLLVVALTCAYHALFCAVALVLALLLVRRAHLRRGVLVAVAGCALGGALLLSPLVLAQREVVSHYTRSDARVEAGSARAADYLRVDRHAVGRHAPWLNRAPGTRRALYPGSVLLLLGCFGALLGLRGPRRRFAIYGVVVGLCSLLLSLGPHLELWSSSPYDTLLRAHVPGFGQLRSPYRISVFVQLAALALAVPALDALARLRLRGRALGGALLAGLALLQLIEVTPIGRGLHRFPEEALHQPWIAWLKQQPAGAVAMVPAAASTDAADYEITVIGMLQGLEHRHPLANGYSGFFPARSRAVRLELQRFPSEPCLRYLRELDVRYAVASRAWLSEHHVRGYAKKHLKLAYDDGTHLVFEL
ncbi:MAG: hypothetical protein PVI30_25960 [Myxococcales bacterium]|jgi:hypothetical protein